MKDNNYFDEFLKNELKHSVEESAPSRDIFNEAWENRKLYEKSNNSVLERMYLDMGKKRIAAVILGAFIGVSVLGLGISPSVRGAVATLFGIDNEGNIVEESEDDLSEVKGTLAEVNDSNKEELERLLGFKVNTPDSIGDYEANGSDVVNIYVGNVKNKDAGEIESKIENAENYTGLYNELSKSYDVEFDSFRLYFKYVDNKLQAMALGEEYGDEVKLSDECKVIDVKDIQGIECTVYECLHAEGNENVQRGEDGEITGIETDKTKRPTGVRKSQYIAFAYNGIVYRLRGGDEHANTNQDEETAFAKEYIKILKNS